MLPVESIAHNLLNSHAASRQANARASRLNAERAEAQRRARQVMLENAIDQADASAGTRDAKHAPERHPEDDEHIDLRA